MDSPAIGHVAYAAVGAAMMLLLDEELVGLSALMGLASAHAQLRWLRVPLPLALPPPPPPLEPSGAESQ
jgi:hypothetical protein